MSFSVTNKLFPSNHKTVFVLDHTPYFGISCESPIELEFLKARGPGFIPMTPICKSLWTSSVESAIEYCRIVWDLFPQGKLVRLSHHCNNETNTFLRLGSSQVTQ
jgi:hypothetical protein